MAKRHEHFIAGLRRARKLIEKGWTQHTIARNSYGNAVSPKDVFAVAWCLTGALYAADVPAWYSKNGIKISNWNDDSKRTQADILACIDNSIAALGG